MPDEHGDDFLVAESGIGLVVTVRNNLLAENDIEQVKIATAGFSNILTAAPAIETAIRIAFYPLLPFFLIIG